MSTTEDHRIDFEPAEIGIDLLSDAAGHPVLFLSGEIDAATLGHLGSCFDAIVDGGATTVSIGFAEVTFMDSSGVNAILDLRRRLGPRARIHLRDCSPAVQRMCDITGVTSAGDITVN